MREEGGEEEEKQSRYLLVDDRQLKRHAPGTGRGRIDQLRMSSPSIGHRQVPQVRPIQVVYVTIARMFPGRKGVITVAPFRRRTTGYYGCNDAASGCPTSAPAKDETVFRYGNVNLRRLGSDLSFALDHEPSPFGERSTAIVARSGPLTWHAPHIDMVVRRWSERSDLPPTSPRRSGFRSSAPCRATAARRPVRHVGAPHRGEPNAERAAQTRRLASIETEVEEDSAVTEPTRTGRSWRSRSTRSRLLSARGTTVF